MSSQELSLNHLHSSDGISESQAERLEKLLPIVTARLFEEDAGHPLANLPSAQMRLCILLHQMGKRTMSDIAEELGISVSAVTQVADRLERTGFVERHMDSGGDRRTRFLTLTPQGKALMDARKNQRINRILVALGSLSPNERESTLSALESLASATG